MAVHIRWIFGHYYQNPNVHGLRPWIGDYVEMSRSHRGPVDDTESKTPKPRTPFPRTRLPPWWVELLILLAGYGLYQLVQSLVTGAESTAVTRARALWDLQGDLHLTPETWLNGAVAGSAFLAWATGMFYGIAHFALTPAVLIWIWVRHSDVYLALRNTLVLASIAALFTYWIFPMAPPRLSIDSIVDTMAAGNILSAADPVGPASLANQYAAMPSLHVAWSIWVALAIVISLPNTEYRHLAWTYPIVTTIVVMATGHHFIADAAAGALIVVGAWYLVPRQGVGRVFLLSKFGVLGSTRPR